MWLISSLFDGPVTGDLDIPIKQKMLKPGRSYIVGRMGKDLNVNDRRISMTHCEFIVGPHTLDDAGNPNARPTLEIVSHGNKKGISFTRPDASSVMVAPGERAVLDSGDTVAFMSRAPVKISWSPIVAVGKDIPLASCAAMGIKLLPTPHKEATHYLVAHYTASMLSAASLITNSCFVKPDWLREVLRLGNDFDSSTDEFTLPLENKYRPAFSPSLLPEQKTFAVWQPNETRLNLFHEHRFVCLQDKTRESDGELRDTLRLGAGEVDAFDVSLGVAKFRAAVVRSRNKEGKTTVLVGDADCLQLAVGKDTWALFVTEARSFGLQILPPSKIIQSVIEANVEALASDLEHEESSPLPEIVPNTIASEPSLVPSTSTPIEEDEPPPEPAPAPRKKLLRRAVTRAPSADPEGSIPPTFPATPAVDVDAPVRPRKVLTRRVHNANVVITGLPDDPSIVLDHPPDQEGVAEPAKKPDSASKVPPTPGRNPRLKRRVIDGATVDSDGPRIGLASSSSKPPSKANVDGEPPLKKFKALFESTNPGADTFEIMNSVPVDSMSQVPMESGFGSGSGSHSQTQTQTQTQTPSQLGMPPPGQGPPRRFARPTASALDVLREEEEESQSVAGSMRGTKRSAREDADGDVEMAAPDEVPAAKKRAVENVNAVAPSSPIKPPSKTQAQTKTITNKNIAGAPVGKPDKDDAFLKAVASSKRGKKHEDEFDREFNKLKISKPVLDVRGEDEDREAEWKVLADFGDDDGLRGNFMTIVEMDVFRQGGQAPAVQRFRNPMWDGKPNFKKFKKKVVGSRTTKVDLFISDANDYGMGPAYWKGGDSQNPSQTQAGTFDSQPQSQPQSQPEPEPSAPTRRAKADNQPLIDSDDETPLPRSRKAPSRAGSVRPSRAGSAVPTKKTTTKTSTKSTPAKSSSSKKTGAALFLDSDDEIKEEDEDEVVMLDDDDDHDSMTLHSSAEVRAPPAASKRTSSRATAATRTSSKATKASSSKSKKAAPIIVEDDSDDGAVFKGFRGRK